MNEKIHKKFKQTWKGKIPNKLINFEKLVRKSNNIVFDEKSKKYKFNKRKNKTIRQFTSRADLNNYIINNPYYLVGKKIEELGITSLNDADITIILSTFTHISDLRWSIFAASEDSVGTFFEVYSEGKFSHSKIAYSTNVTDFFLKKFLLATVLYTLDLVPRNNNILAKALFYMPKDITSNVNILNELVEDNCDVTKRNRILNYSTYITPDYNSQYRYEAPISISSNATVDNYVKETINRLLHAKINCVDENLNSSTIESVSQNFTDTIFTKFTKSDFKFNSSSLGDGIFPAITGFDHELLEDGKFYSTDYAMPIAVMENPDIRSDGSLFGPLTQFDVNFNIKDIIILISSPIMFLSKGNLDPRPQSSFHYIKFSNDSNNSSASSIVNSSATGIVFDTDISILRYQGLLLSTDCVYTVKRILFNEQFIADSKVVKDKMGELSEVQFNTLKEVFVYFTGSSVETINALIKEEKVSDEDKQEFVKLYSKLTSEICSVINSLSSSLTSSVSFEPVDIEQYGEDITTPYNVVYLENFIVYNSANFTVNPAESVGLFISIFKETLNKLSSLLRKLALLVSDVLSQLFELLNNSFDIILSIGIKAFFRLITTSSVTRVKYMASETFNDSKYVVIPVEDIKIPERFKTSMLNHYNNGEIQEILIVNKRTSLVIKHISADNYVVNIAAVRFEEATFGLGFVVTGALTKEDWGTDLRNAFEQEINAHTLNITLNQFNEYLIVENNYKAVSRGMLDGTISHIPIVGKFTSTALSIQFVLSVLTSAELSEGYLQVFGIDSEQYDTIIKASVSHDFSVFEIIESDDYILTTQEVMTGSNIIVEEPGAFATTIDSLVAYWAGRKLANLFFIVAKRIRYRKTLRLNKSSIVDPLKEGQASIEDTDNLNSELLLAALAVSTLTLNESIESIDTGGSSLVYS